MSNATALADRDISAVVQAAPGPLKRIMEDSSGVFVAGGFIRSVISREQRSDIDVFATSIKLLNWAAEELEREQEGVWYSTENARTFISSWLPIQLIHKWQFEAPGVCIANFDFTIAQSAVWYDDGWRGLCSDRFYRDLAAKRLVYTGSDAPGGSLLRALKFVGRGYTIDVDSLAPIVSELAGVDGVAILKDLREVDPAIEDGGGITR